MSTNSDPVITVAQAKKLKTLITKHVKAAVDASWVGAGDPSSCQYLANQDAKATKNLQDYITKLRGGMTA